MKLHCHKYCTAKAINLTVPQTKPRRTFNKQNSSAHREFFDQLAKKLDIRDIDDWSKITTKIVLKHGGYSLLRQYGTLISALSSLFPHESWKFWLFNVYDRSYWEDRQNHRRYFDWLEQKLNIQHKDDWYRVPSSKVRSLHGNFLLRTYYNNRLTSALPIVYPEHPWQPWKFGKVGKGYWENQNNIVSYLRWLQDQLGIKNLEEWSCIPQTVLKDFGIGHLINRYGSIHKLLKIAYPDTEWNTESQRPKTTIMKFGAKSKSEYHFSRVVQEIFPGSQILQNHRIPSLVFPGSQRDMEFDIFIPQHQIAMEYQGQQHYVSHYLNGSPQDLQLRDTLKSTACQQQGITYVQVPFWWDRKKSSLIATLLAKNPSLQSVLPTEEGSIPIPEKIPEGVLKQWQKYVSKNGQLANIFQTPILSQWSEGVSPVDWWVYNPQSPSLKEQSYLTVFWNGQVLKDMSGNTLELSAGWQQHLPKLQLYGILRTRNNQRIESLKDPLKEEDMEFIALDTPGLGHMKYEERINSLRSMAVNVWEPVKCTSIEQLLQICAAVEEANLFLDQHALHLRKPNSYFLDETSYKLLQNYEYVEGTVSAMGNDNITCKISNGMEITVPTTQRVEREHTATLRHRGMALTKLTLPVLVSARKSSSGHQRLCYRLATGQTFGILPKCKACKKTVQRKSVRIEAYGTFTTAESGPQAAKYTLCTDMDCIKKFNLEATHTEGVGIFLPTFEGFIGVPEALKTEFEQQKPTFNNLDQVQWVNVQ